MKLARRALFCGKAGLYVLLWLSVCTGSSPHASAKERSTSSSLPWLQIAGSSDGCVGERELVREVERNLDRAPHAGVRVEARARGRGWLIEMWHAGGQYAVREFPVLPDACELRVRALALSIALAVEHAVASSGAQRTTEGELAVDAPSPDALGWALGLHAGASLGELPTAAPVVGLDARVALGDRLSFELRAFANPLKAERAFAGARLAVQQWTGAAGSCLSPFARRSFRLDLCLGLELGGALGRATGVAEPSTEAAGSGALDFGLVARWSARPRFGLVARVEGFGRFWTPRFVLLDADGALFEEHRLTRVGGRLWLGVAWLSR